MRLAGSSCPFSPQMKQHRVSKEENLQADMAAPQVTQVALYRLRNNDEGTPEEMPGCVREARSKL